MRVGREGEERWQGFLDAAGLLGFLIIVIGPILSLVYDGVVGVAARPGGALALLGLAWPRGRSLDLLGSSLGLAVVSTLLAGLLGLAAALSDRPRKGWLRWLPLAFVAVPPYVHALAWSSLLYRMGLLARGLGGDLPTGGPAVAVLVTSLSRLPIAYGMSVVALALLPAELLEAGRSLRSGGRVLWRIALPLAAPVVAAGLALCFLLTITDYGVPSLFQVRVLALAVFAEYSASGDAARALAMALPILLLAGLASILLVAGWRRAASSSREIDAEATREATTALLSGPVRGLARLAMGLLLLQALVFALSLVAAAGDLRRLWPTLAPAVDDLFYSMAVALVAGLLACAAGMAMARRLVGMTDGERGVAGRWPWLVTVLPLAFPAPLFGIGLIELWGQGTLSPVLPHTDLLPSLATAGRFAPIAALLMVAALVRRDETQIEAMRVYQPSAIRGWWRVGRRLSAPGYVTAFVTVFALSLGEVGATLMVLPPGRSSFAVRTFNYLHYGASEAVAGSCLLLALLSSLAMVGALRAFEAGRRA